MGDHFTNQGLLCAGMSECAWCRRCGSCNAVQPGPAPADGDVFEPVCDECARWLKDIEAIRATAPTVEHPKRKRRSTVRA